MVKSFKVVITLASLIATVVAFQNCSSGFQPLSAPLASNLGSSTGQGNGDGSAPPSGGTNVTPTAYHTDAGKLYDACNVEVVLRGVNKMVVFTDRAGNAFPEIAKSGANAVRFMWLAQVPASEAVQTLRRAIASHLIPIWELHDATGDFSQMPVIEAYWTNPDTIAVLKQFDSRMILNIANEAGTDVADGTLVSTYTRIMTKLRAAGLKMPLMIDAAGYGRGVEQLLRVAPTLLAADPLHNVLFSWHAYDPTSANELTRITNAMMTAKTQKIPFLIGEFGNVTPGACQLQVPYKHLITQAEAFGIGYLAWSWDNSNGDCVNAATGKSYFDMVGDGINIATLNAGWATEVLMTDPSSIKNTSKRSFWLTNPTLGKCSP